MVTKKNTDFHLQKNKYWILNAFKLFVNSQFIDHKIIVFIDTAKQLIN